MLRNIIEGSGSAKTNSLFNLISHRPGIDKICLMQTFIQCKISIANWQKRKYRLKGF